MMLLLKTLLALDYFNPKVCANCFGRLDDPRHDFEKCKMEMDKVLAEMELKTGENQAGKRY